jgi:hypothetical protein
MKLKVELVAEPHKLHFKPLLASVIPKPGITIGTTRIYLFYQFLVAF